jgi:outer membrane protein
VIWQIRRILAVVVLMMARAVQASAQSASYLPPSFLSSVSGLWTVALGVNVTGQPAFDGGKGDSLGASPIFTIGRAGGFAERFRSPHDSSSIALFDDEGLSAGLAGKLKSGRTASSHTELKGLGDVDRTLEVGGFVQYFPVDWFRLRAEVRQGFGGHHGVVADLAADAVVPIWQRLTLSGGPRFTWESTKATAPYFGIDAAQAFASGLPAFDAKGGAHSAGAGTQLRYRINPQWEAHAYLEYERLLGDAAASPLVTQRGSPNQTSFGLGASYAFDVRVP